MKTTKSITTAFELEGGNLIIGVNNATGTISHHTEFYLKTGDGVMCYTAEEMVEIYSLTDSQMLNIIQVLGN